MRIYIIGMPGTGKSHFGKMLARAMHLSFIDTDEQVEQKTQLSIRQLIELKGEAVFRTIESDVLFKTALNAHCVISTGGGTPVHNNQIQWMKTNGIVVWIDTDLSLIAKRIAQNITRRPLFMGLDEAQIAQKLSEIYTLRKKIYKNADIFLPVKTLHNTSLTPVIQRIVKLSKRAK
jgi:shikimate kinase